MTPRRLDSAPSMPTTGYFAPCRRCDGTGFIDGIGLPWVWWKWLVLQRPRECYDCHGCGICYEPADRYHQSEEQR